jgi:hypothetical protein
MPSRSVPVAVAALLVAVSATAGAAESHEAREREARKACFMGNVERGVEILVDLYVETQHPNYIYNQARCFERNGKYDQALLSYEDYLRKAKDLGGTERSQVEKSIADLRAKVTGTSAGTSTSAAGPAEGPGGAPALLSPALDGASPPPAAGSNEAPPLTPAGQDQTSAPAWPWQRTAGVVSLIAAGGGLVLGVAGTVLRQGRAGDFNPVCTYYMGQPVPIDSSSTMDFDCRGKYDAVQAAERMMWIGYLGGGVLAAAGVTLLLIAPRADQPRARAWAGRCAPTLGGTGVACGWSF